MKNNLDRFTIILTIIFLFLPTALFAEEIHTETGLDPNREFFSTDQNEYIDPFGGGLTLVYTDMVFPGNGGLDLEIKRTYNNKRVFTGLVYRSDYSPLGHGWDIHFGRVAWPATATGTISFELPDATVHTAYASSTSYIYYTKNQIKVFFDHTNSAKKPSLTLTDGTELEFGARTEINNRAWYLATKISRNNQSINIFYNADKTIDYVIDTVGRTVKFNYQTINLVSRLTSISCLENTALTVQYKYINVNQYMTPKSILSEVRSPVGNGWAYTYYPEDSYYELKTVTNPYGGVIIYNFENYYLSTGPVTDLVFRGIKFKKQIEQIGRGIVDGTWSFVYNKNDNGFCALNACERRLVGKFQF